MSFLDLPFEELLSRTAAKEPAPGGGSVAAMTTAFAAALVAMAARFASAQMAEGPAMAERADALRHRAGRLAEEDAAAYGEVLAAYRLPREPDGRGRAARVRATLLRATEVPLQVAEVAAEVAGAGARLARDGNPNLAGDAVTAVLLADAAARSAAGLVHTNVEAGKLGDDLVRRVEAYVAAAAEAARALGPA